MYYFKKHKVKLTKCDADNYKIDIDIDPFRVPKLRYQMQN